MAYLDSFPNNSKKASVRAIVENLLETKAPSQNNSEYSTQMMQSYDRLSRILDKSLPNTEQEKHLKYLALCLIESNLRHKSQDLSQADKVHQQVCAAYIDMGGTIVGMEKKEAVVVLGQTPDWAQNVPQQIKKERTWMEFAKTIIKAVHEAPSMIINSLKKLVTGNIIDKKAILPPVINNSLPPAPNYPPPPIPKSTTQGLESVTHDHSDKRATISGSAKSTSSKEHQVS